MRPSSVHGVEDMAVLEDLHDGAIMHNLFLRYQQRHIYVSLSFAPRHRPKLHWPLLTNTAEASVQQVLECKLTE